MTCKLKQCNKCKEWKNESEFSYRKDINKLSGQCKQCKRIQDKKYWKSHKKEKATYDRKYREEHKDELAKKKTKYYNDHKEKIAKKSKKYREEHKEEKRIYDRKYQEDHKKEIAKKNKKYREEHKEGIKKYRKEHEMERKKYRKEHRKRDRENQKKKRRENPKIRLNDSMRRAIGKSLNGQKNSRHWEHLVNFTLKELVIHLEKQFTVEMTWKNYGNYWHIDHIIPLDYFNYEIAEDAEFKMAWCLGNLQPLEKTLNFSKHNRLILENILANKYSLDLLIRLLIIRNPSLKNCSRQFIKKNLKQILVENGFGLYQDYT